MRIHIHAENPYALRHQRGYEGYVFITHSSVSIQSLECHVEFPRRGMLSQNLRRLSGWPWRGLQR